MSVRVVVADDQPVVRAGFGALLDAQDDLEVVGQAADGLELVDLVAVNAPDVAVVDVRMPRMDGIEAARHIIASGVETRLLMVTTFDLDAYVYDALKSGASGFLLKDTPGHRIVEAVRMVAEGSMLLGPNVTRRLVEQVAAHRPPMTMRGLDDLTSREQHVCALLARGMSNAEIADTLVLGEQTVKSHVSEVLRKLGVRDRVQVVVLAYESGLVSPGSAAVSPDTGASSEEPSRQVEGGSCGQLASMAPAAGPSRRATPPW